MKVLFATTNPAKVGKYKKALEELPDKMQPKTHVRRVNGKELIDDEYYKLLNEIKKDKSILEN